MIHGFPYAGPLPDNILVTPQKDQYTLLGESITHFGNPPARVLYPCSGPSAIPVGILQNSRVIYLDKDPEAIAHIEREVPGAAAFIHDATQPFNCDPVDALILFNPVIFPEKLFANLRSGGKVFANNYHRTATYLYGHADFKLIGAQTQKGWLDDSVARSFFTPVADDTTWQQKTVSPWNTSLPKYDAVCALRVKVGGPQDSGSLIEWYQHFMAQALDWQAKNIPEGQFLQMLDRYPAGYDFPFKPLPTQQSTIDDCIIFEKL